MDIKQVWDGKNLVITKDAVDEFNNLFVMEPRYQADDRILTVRVNELITSDSKQDDIYTLITLINSFYSTRMGGDLCYKYADVLYNHHADIWNLLQNVADTKKDFQIVQDVLNQCGAKKEKQELRGIAFSFISKYFSILARYARKEDRFPIYDNVVARMLHYYYQKCYEDTKKYSLGQKNENYKIACSVYKSPHHKDYITYANIIHNLCGSDIKYKALDDYLWNLGRKIENQLTLDAKEEIIKQEKQNTDKKRGNPKSPSIVVSDKIDSTKMTMAIEKVMNNLAR